MQQELFNAQELLRTIDRLSNVIQKVSKSQKDDVAHLIHRLIESGKLNTDTAREVTGWCIEANKDAFMLVSTV